MNLPEAFIEELPEIKVNTQILLAEFNNVSTNKIVDVWDSNATTVQRKFHLFLNGIYFGDKSKIPYTLKVYEYAKNLIPEINSINYRYILPNTCYNWHVDTGKKCIHVPLITNEGCWFVYEHKSFQMLSDGQVYLVQNDKPHSFMNAGLYDRLHLTFENIS